MSSKGFWLARLLLVVGEGARAVVLEPYVLSQELPNTEVEVGDVSPTPAWSV